MIPNGYRQSGRTSVSRRGSVIVLLGFVLILLLPSLASAQTRRVVLIKVDGLPFGLLDQMVKERNARTGKSQLPWIEHIFYQRGTRLTNFYTRGMSLSAPSWSTLDTGQHLQIKGNVEFDRYTLHTYDYLNFIPFYMKSAAGSRIDMPGTEVLDSQRIPLLADAFAHEDRYIGFQLYQRGMRFNTLKEAIQKRFMKHPRDLLDEWTMGLDMRMPFFEQMERELIGKLQNPDTRYLDLYISGFDHIAHHVNDYKSHLSEVQVVDAMLGRIWTAIQKTPEADQTVLIMVSDHGFNSVEGIYSQGYNLVKLLGSRAGGGHHVITKRRLLLDYSLKGIYFMVPLITTTTDESTYLKGQSSDYPTALLDFDGNERASIHLRHSDLNVLQILLQQLQRKQLPPAVRTAATRSFFDLIDRRRAEWQKSIDEINEELLALRSSIARQQTLLESLPKKFTAEEIRLGRDDHKKRVLAQLERWISQDKAFAEYVRTLINLLGLSREDFVPSRIKIEDVIAKHAMGNRNSVYELQNYVMGMNAAGLQVRPDGSLDLERSFQRVNYFDLLHRIAIRNNVQPQVSNKPIDMIVTRIPSALVAAQLGESDLTSDVVLVYGGAERQAFIMGREGANGLFSFRYQPVKNLHQDASGQIRFETAAWEPGFPLHLFEDPELNVAPDRRQAWLSEWHTDLEWLQATHRTKYSIGVTGLYEEIARHENPFLIDEPSLSQEERRMRRFARRLRDLTETDLLLMANDHWNFDVRGFNPGGNHGSFFRISTHSTLMFAGGERTGIPMAVRVDQPYDSLSFAPTVLALTGNLRDDNNPTPTLLMKGFRRFPGRTISEVLAGRNR